jgi:hypothetical protein
MLLKLSDQIRNCYQRAADARLKADTAQTAADKQDFLDAEQRWLSLARGYEFSERLSRFTNSVRKAKA